MCVWFGRVRHPSLVRNCSFAIVIAKIKMKVTVLKCSYRLMCVLSCRCRIASSLQAVLHSHKTEHVVGANHLSTECEQNWTRTTIIFPLGSVRPYTQADRSQTSVEHWACHDWILIPTRTERKVLNHIMTIFPFRQLSQFEYTWPYLPLSDHWTQ